MNFLDSNGQTTIKPMEAPFLRSSIHGVLPQTGYVRQPLLVGDAKTGKLGILPFSASTLWRRVRSGTFPAPVKLSERVTAWKAEDVHCWLADPVNYQAEKANA